MPVRCSFKMFCVLSGIKDHGEIGQGGRITIEEECAHSTGPTLSGTDR